MGEYATRKSDNTRIKIGTCEMMYYLRFDDIDKILYDYDLKANSLFWRLPFPDEDTVLPGDYKDFNRGALLVDFIPVGLEVNPGIIQAKSDCGLLINVKCYHGLKLPEKSSDLRPFWNGKTSHFFELAHVKYVKGKLLPIVHCRFCYTMWRFNWNEILPHLDNYELKKRLIDYSNVKL